METNRGGKLKTVKRKAKPRSEKKPGREKPRRQSPPPPEQGGTRENLRR